MLSVIEMTDFYDARGLFWSLRPEKMINFLTQSALGQICRGKWPVPSGAELCLGLWTGPRRSDVSGAPCATHAIPQKILNTHGGGGGGDTIHTLASRGPMCADVRPLGPSF